MLRVKRGTLGLGLLLVLFLFSTAEARKLGDITMPDTLSGEGLNLVLNGAGFRTKYFFNIYGCGLYLQKQDKDAKKIIEADEPMGVRMHFVFRKVSGKEMSDMLDKGFTKATKGNTAPIREQIEHLLALLPATLYRGDIVDLFYVPGRGIVCYINGKYAGEDPGLNFKQAVFAIWLGDEPVNETLKKEMLGK
ncbi:MAG: chalcone isomerase family protein [Thermodesulfobacteriota bacterium]